MSEPKKIILIDGHSLAYRAFYALPPDLVTSSGQMINAVYGFTSMLIKVLEELRPGAVIVAFDKGKAEFRTERFADYKAHRKPMPDGLREQLDMIHAVLGSLGMPVFEQEGYEADDILATLTEKLPPWMVNRPNDPDTGADYHLFGSDVDLRLRDDINRMKMIRCYRGVRHEQGQKVRGQRTRSNGRTGLTVGVIKKTAIQAAQAAKKEEEGGKKAEKKEPETKEPEKKE